MDGIQPINTGETLFQREVYPLVDTNFRVYDYLKAPEDLAWAYV